MRYRWFPACVWFVLATWLGALVAAADEPPIIAAASDLRFALTDVAAAFTEDTGKTVNLSFGSTGNLATQIREGAPFEMFMAADQSFIADLYKEGFTRDEGHLFAIGRLVIMAPHDSILKPDEALDHLAALLDEGKIRHFAIANPDHAPYGQRAEQALRHRGLWEAVKPHLVMGENVGQAAQFAVSGNAEGGLIAHSLALAPEMRALGGFALIPSDWHAPLMQRMVLLKTAGRDAEEFLRYMQSPAAREIMARYGFTLPQEG